MRGRGRGYGAGETEGGRRGRGRGRGRGPFPPEQPQRGAPQQFYGAPPPEHAFYPGPSQHYSGGPQYAPPLPQQYGYGEPQYYGGRGRGRGRGSDEPFWRKDDTAEPSRRGSGGYVAPVEEGSSSARMQSGMQSLSIEQEQETEAVAPAMPSIMATLLPRAAQSAGPSQTQAIPPHLAPPQAAESAGPFLTAPTQVIPSHLGPPRPAAPTQAPPQQPIVAKPAMPLRPNLGTIGQKVKLRVNHFPLSMKINTIFHYDVEIKPSVSSKGIARALKREFIRLHLQDLGGSMPAFDGAKNMYSPVEFLFESKTFTVALREETPGATAGRERSFDVTLKKVATLDGRAMDQFLQHKRTTLPQELLQALDIVLREGPTIKYVPVGRSLFHSDFGIKNLEEGVVAWKGFYQSIRPTMQGLVLNVDVSATAFYDNVEVIEMLRQAIRGFDPRRPLQDADRVKIKKLLVRLKVEVTHQKIPRRYRICGLSKEATAQLTFSLDGAGETSLSDYFLNVYNHQLKFPQLPALQMQGKKVIYLPMELCKICPGQKYGRKLSDNQTRNILDFACQGPQARERATQEIMSLPDAPGRDEYAAAFGLKINVQMSMVEGRVLPPPKLKYGAGSKRAEIFCQNGSWNLMDSKVYHPATIENWALVNFARIDYGYVEYFCNCLTRRCQELGIKMNPRTAVPIKSDRLERFEYTLRGIFQEFSKARGRNANLQLVVCIMDGKSPIYGDLKRVCETEIGIVTQCCLVKNIKNGKGLSQYLANLAMKINVKVGGTNVNLLDELPKALPSIFSSPTIIFGSDVTHPAPGDDQTPSISSLVASMDWPAANLYLARARTQASREEVITSLKGMAKELLEEFKVRTNYPPQRIIFFRDGVSEGQFAKVLETELQYLRQAFYELHPEYKPRVTFIAVQKRHHTRMFPADQNNWKNNIKPGTVVDSTITHPSEFDFYLCSHAGLKGTSKPTHYHVLYDENGFKADDLQMLINNLCYTYSRCTKAVSVVPPVYYADLVAYRARLYIDPTGSGSDVSSARAESVSEATRSSSSASRPAPPQVRPLPTIKDDVQRYMFYC